MDFNIKNKVKHKILSKKSLTNKVFFGIQNNDPVVLKIYNKKNFKYTNIQNEKIVMNLIKDIVLFPPILKYKPKKYLLTKDLKTLSFDELKFEKKHIVKIAKTLKKLHNIPFDKITKFNPIQKIVLYKENISHINDNKIINDVKEYLKEFDDYKLCHNDLVKGNILFKNNNIFIIDYEFSSANDIYFDIASFFTECDISIEFQKIFLDEYFDNKHHNKKVLKMWMEFHNVLWYYWALQNYKNTNKYIYKKIANHKLNKINKFKI